MTETNLAWTRIADFDLFITKDFGTTGFVKANGFGHDFLFSNLQCWLVRRIALIGL
ncbi:hypothetical protein D3C81_2256500 [compost metagenome]